MLLCILQGHPFCFRLRVVHKNTPFAGFYPVKGVHINAGRSFCYNLTSKIVHTCCMLRVRQMRAAAWS